MRFFKTMFVLSLPVVMSFSAVAESYCAKHDKLAEVLKTKFGEQQQGMGLAGKSAMVELYVSQKGTFTLVTTDTNGLSCIVGAGDSWEKLEAKDQLSAL